MEKDNISIGGKHFKELICEKDIRQRVVFGAKFVNELFNGKNPLFIIVSDGAFMFAADLLRHISPNMKCGIASIKIKSYEGTESTGKFIVTGFDMADVSDRDVVILEDIVDTGKTIGYLRESAIANNCKSFSVVCAVSKPDASKERPLFPAFKIENKFIIGYGLDYNGKGRNLSSIYVEA